MRTILGIALGVLVASLATPTAGQIPPHFWSQRFGGTNFENSFALAVDGSGNVVITGQFLGTANFGGGNLVSAGNSDIFLAKYDSNGLFDWNQRFGSATGDQGTGVALDGSGNVLVTGIFSGTVNFGGANLVSAGASDIFVAKYNSSGVHQWSQRFGSSSSDRAESIAVDVLGNVIVTGSFSGTVNFGGANLMSAGDPDVFLAKYNSSGVHQWSQRFGGTAGDQASSVTVDVSGNVVMTGDFGGTVNFGGANLVSAGDPDVFLARYNSLGVHQWSQSFGSAGTDRGQAVAVDGSGNVVVTGNFDGNVSFGGATLVSAGDSDAFLAKYNSGGVHQWSQNFGSTSGDVGSGIAVDGSGNVVLTGSFEGTVDFGGGNLVSVGSLEVFVAKYNASGAHQWSLRGGGASIDFGYAAAVDGSGNAVVTGEFRATANFGGGNLVSAGVSDIFLAKYGSNAAEKPVITSILDIGNDQGKRVRIQFSRSGHDVSGTSTPVIRYESYRRNDALPLATPDTPTDRVSREQLLDLGWVEAGSIDAHLADGYLMDAPTDADSTVAFGQHYSVFFIRAGTASPGTFFDSPIDSGYSVDNLAPGVPGGFAYASGVLSWNESNAEDFDYFSVYGSNTSSFGSATLVDYTTATNLDVTSAGYVFYFITATDFSGNEGNPAAINTLSDIGGTPKGYVLSISAYPNPFNPETTVRYTVATKGPITIAVYDLRGAHVATLVDLEVEAGAYTVAWDGRDLRGNQAGSGVYFARIVTSGGTGSYKMTLLK